MLITKPLKTFAVLFFALLFAITPMLYSPSVVEAETLKEQLERVQKELNLIKKEKNGLQGEIDTLNRKAGGYSGQIGKLQAKVEKFQLDIAEVKLEIDELKINIDILEEQIFIKEKIITERLEEITSLEEITDVRIREAYADYRLVKPGENSIFGAQSVNEYFKESQYRQLLQKRTNTVMQSLLEQKKQLEYDREQLEEQKITLQKDKEILAEQRLDLKKKQKELKKDIEEYYGLLNSTQYQIQSNQGKVAGLSDQQKKKQAKAEQLRQQIFNNYRPPGAGQYVLKGGYIGRQGATGLATGAHVHFMTHFNGASRNPCSALPSKFSGCGWGGNLRWPLDGTIYFTSSYGSRCMPWGCSFHDAIDIAHPVWNAPIFAAHNGYVYKGVDSYGALYVILCQNTNCGNGWKTGYWHMSQF